MGDEQEVKPEIKLPFLNHLLHRTLEMGSNPTKNSIFFSEFLDKFNRLLIGKVKC